MNKNNNILNWDLVSKYISGEMDTNEAEEFMNYINENKKRKLLFDEIVMDCHNVDLYYACNNIDTKKAFNKVVDRLETENLISSKQENKEKKYVFTYSSIAATILILISISFYLLKTDTANFKIVKTENFNKIITLPDGSEVSLSPNSYIKYPTKFENTKRDVIFKGEGFFDIAKDKSKPFTISVNNAKVRVLGTSFNVNSKFKASKVEVTVKTGRVELSLEKQKIILNKNDIGIVSNQLSEKKINTNKNYLAWKTKKFVFEGEKLKNVIKTVNKAYNANLIIDGDSLNNLKFNSTFDNLPLDSVLDILCTSYSLKYTKQNKSIILTTK